MSVSNALKRSRFPVAIVSILALTGCAIGQDVRTNRAKNNKDLNNPPNKVVAAVREPTVPMKENAKWWEPVQQKCGPYKTNLVGCYVSFQYRVDQPQRYVRGEVGDWTPIQVAISYRKDNPNFMYVPKELNGSEASAMIAGKETPEDVAALAIRVAKYSICEGGDVRLRTTVGSADPSGAFYKRGRAGGWSFDLECSTWRDPQTVQRASTEIDYVQPQQSNDLDLKAHVDALLEGH